LYICKHVHVHMGIEFFLILRYGCPCVFMCACVCLRVHAYMCVCVCVCVCVHAYMRIHRYLSSGHPHRHMYIQTHIYTLTHTGRSGDTNTHNQSYQSTHPPSLELRWDGVFVERTRILSEIQFTMQFIESVVTASWIFLIKKTYKIHFFLIKKTYKRNLSIYLFYMSLVTSRLLQGGEDS